MSTNDPVRLSRDPVRRVANRSRSPALQHRAPTDFNQGRTRTWDWHGSKARWPPGRSGISSHLSRCRSGCCSPSRCGAGCGCGSATSGSPTAKTSCSCTSRAATRWPTSRMRDIGPGVLVAEDRVTAASRPRRDALVHRRGRRARGQPRRLAAHRAAGARRRARRAGGVRVAGHGRVLRGRRTHRRARRRRLPPHRHPRDLTPSRGPRRRSRHRRHPPARWPCTNPVSPRAGMSPATTSTNRRWNLLRDRRSAPTRAWPATTTSATANAPPGRTPTPGPRLAG